MKYVHSLGYENSMMCISSINYGESPPLEKLQWTPMAINPLSLGLVNDCSTVCLRSSSAMNILASYHFITHQNYLSDVLMLL